MRILFTALIAATSMLSIQAQERAISQAEFAAAEHAANAPFIAKQVPARWTITTESRMEGRPQTDYRSRSVMEFASRQAQRTSTESTFGGKPLQRETTITIGEKTFVQSGNGAWKTNSDVSEPQKDRNDDFAVIQTKVDHRYLGTAVFNGKKAHMYLKTERTSQVDKATGNVSERETSTRYWFGENEDLYRSEYRSKTVTGDKVLYTSIDLEKEFDPSISVSPPVM